MTATHEGRSAAIRARVNHPIIDSDGHQVEMGPIFLDYLKAEAGPKVAERFPVVSLDGYADAGWWTLSPQERHNRRSMRPTWWATPARNSKDLATALYPKLFHQRLDEF